jgi:hypothetical protein
LADEAEPPVEPPVEPVEPVEPLAAKAAEAPVTSSTGEPAASSDGPEPATGDPPDATTGLLPMSYARPPTSSSGEDPTEGTTGGPPDPAPAGTTGDPPEEPDPTAGGTPPVPAGPPCLEGEWLADDLHTYYRRDIERQAHGRTVKSRGETGSHRLRFAPGVLHGEADHRRLVFVARLADVDIRYTVDVHGAFEAPIRVEAPDTLVVERPRSTTLRAREVVRFSAHKSETRWLTVPIEGRWQVTCGAGSLELRPLEAGKPGPALRFVRPSP